MIFRKSFSYQRFPTWTSNTSVLKKFLSQPYIQWVLGLKWVGGEADHMPSSGVTVNSVCGCTPFFPYAFMVYAFLYPLLELDRFLFHQVLSLESHKRVLKYVWILPWTHFIKSHIAHISPCLTLLSSLYSFLSLFFHHQQLDYYCHAGCHLLFHACSFTCGTS